MEEREKELYILIIAFVAVQYTPVFPRFFLQFFDFSGKVMVY